MKNRSELVSIVLPFFQAGKYIAEAIESVLSQDGFDAWHLYLIDDGSNDADSGIARRYCRKYPSKMSLLEHPGHRRRGTSASRNLGLRQSGGALIAFLDADDIWYPHKLRTQVATLNDHPEADMTYGAALRWHSWNGGHDLHVPAHVDGHGLDCVVPGSALLTTFLRDESLVPCTCSVLIRRAALQRSGYFEDEFRGIYDDQVLYSKLCLAGNVFVSSDCVASYRQHPESCCRTAEANGSGEAGRQQFLSWLKAFPGSEMLPSI